MNQKKKKDSSLSEMLDARDQFLDGHPELNEYQAKIDEALNQAGDDPQKRMKALAELMSQQLTEKLVPALHDLKNILENKVLDEPEKISPSSFQRTPFEEEILQEELKRFEENDERGLWDPSSKTYH